MKNRTTNSPGPVAPLLLLALFAATLAWLFSLGPIAQDPAYHDFADQRACLGLPNCQDLLSNLPFLLVGLLGLWHCRRAPLGPMRPAWQLLFLGLVLVSAGSAWYHWQPDNARLLWDRLPMTLGFMGLWIALLGEHANPAMARRLLLPALCLGLSSVLYWRLSGDLRLYYWVQLLPLLTIPALWLYPARHTHRWLLLPALGCYLLAKLAERHDLWLFQASGTLISGHSLKHLLAAAGCGCLLWMLKRRRYREKHL